MKQKEENVQVDGLEQAEERLREQIDASPIRTGKEIDEFKSELLHEESTYKIVLIRKTTR